MAFYATPYTIHFDDTMAYQSHHFLTSFKFQCAARETLLYGDLIFDRPGVPEALDSVHLFTADAYSRNLRPAFLGDRLVILLSLEEWGAVSARFCYRVLNQQGEPVCAGFQTHVCADPQTGQPTPLPEPLRKAFDEIRQIEERGLKGFRESVLAGGEQTADLFSSNARELARQYLRDRYPVPRIIGESQQLPEEARSNNHGTILRDRHLNGPSLSGFESASAEVWVFPGQGAFDAKLFCRLLTEFRGCESTGKSLIDACSRTTSNLIGGEVDAFFSGQLDRCEKAAKQTVDLCQVGIYLQGVLTAYLRRKSIQPAILMGHSIGEIAALTVAGSLSLVDGVRAVCERVRAVRRWGPKDGKIMAIMADRATIAEEIALEGLTGVVIAGRNHDKQTIVSGPSDQLFHLGKRMQKIGRATVEIFSPTSFHHPVLMPAAKVWREVLQELSFQSPETTIYSPIGRQMVVKADDIPTILSTQLLRPFDLQGAIEDLALAGFKTLVDCGSSGVLTRLLEQTAPESFCVLNAANELEWISSVSEREVSNDLVMPPESRAETSAVTAKVLGESTEFGTDGDGSAAPHQVIHISPPKPTIAIVGQGCLLPGGASTPERLYSLLMEGRSGIVDLREIDPHWESDFYCEKPLPDKSTSALAGIVHDRDIVVPPNVNPQFFNGLSRAQQLLCVAISPCLELLNSQDRILCLVGSTADGFQDQDRIAALRGAGIDPTDPRIADRLADHPAAYQSPYAAVRHVFDHMNPHCKSIQLIDAACASSLYSVALGMSALERGEVDVVVAGGVYCPGPGNNCLFSQFGGLTSTGCRPFDSMADGVVFSEGAAFIVLRRFEEAAKLGQKPIAIIRGFGLSSDGRSPSANVPQASGQMIAMRRCYQNERLAPSSIHAIEGHGTSTPAGDSTELKSLSTFFSSSASQPMPLHSLKGLLGHTGWAAGAASIIAVTEMFKNKLFPAQANFSEPSNALAQANKVLFVPRQPLPLPESQCRIAIDGFGFGGANAHLVLESVNESELRSVSANAGPKIGISKEQDSEQDLVVVARYEIDASQFRQLDASTRPNGSKFSFDCDAIPLPPGIILLPDLREDMDFSQRLALHLTGKVFDQLPKLDPEITSQTSLIIALEGKTERAVEATLRVLAPRFLREWSDLPEAASIRKAYQEMRPSGPYTLQCMMPNVAAGRAALHFNLHGPNFVIDAGENSLASAISSARLLLGSGPGGGTKLAIVSQISVNHRLTTSRNSDDIHAEVGTAYAITTRRIATELGLPDLGSPDDLLSSLAVPSQQQALQDRSRSQFELHTPEWVEMPMDFSFVNQRQERSDRCLAFVQADRQLVEELLSDLNQQFLKPMMIAIGPESSSLVKQLNHPNLCAIEMLDTSSSLYLTELLDQVDPNLILAVSRPVTWDSEQVVREAARNALCEFVFVATKHLIRSVRAGETEVWGLFPGAWGEGVSHPITGPLVGMMKSIKRELPMARMGVIGHSSVASMKILKCLSYERSLVSNTDIEVVYDSQRRLVRRLRRVEESLCDVDENPRKLELDKRSVVLATGGARGVTALMVEALLRDHGCTVIAWGRSPLESPLYGFQSPMSEQDFYKKFLADNPGTTPVVMKQQYQKCRASWETRQRIEELSALPGIVQYMQVDVNDCDAVEQALSLIKSKFGHIDLIIHGAGVQFSKRLEERSLNDFRITFGIKVGGLANLIEAGEKQFGRIIPVHALTSAYSIFGNDGQHDYGAANETLDRCCEWISSRRDSNWTSLAWPAWNGVGMTRGSEYQALAAERNLALLGPEEGQLIFRQVIEGNSRAVTTIPLSQAEQSRYRVWTLPTNPFGRSLQTLEMPISLSELDYLTHHKAAGQPTLPGAWIVEHMVRAVLRLADRPVRQLSVENIRFRRFVRIQNQGDCHFRVVVDANKSGYLAWLLGEIVSPSGIRLATDAVFASAFISLDPKPFNSRVRPRECSDSYQVKNDRVVDPYCNDHQSVQLSGPFDCLRQIVIGPNGRHATFSPRIGYAWRDIVPSLLLDACIRVAGMHAVEDGLHVPTKIGRVVLPVGVSTQSLDSANWTIQATSPVVLGDDIRCGRVEVIDDQGNIRLVIDDAIVTKLRK